MNHLRAALGLAFALAVSAPAFPTVAEPPAPLTPPVSTVDGLAISGHDPVAYFTEARPRVGVADLEHSWNGARWRFATAANRDAFVKEPTKFAPQYGGYCAWAVSRDYTYRSDPEAWRIVDGRLFLNYDKRVQEQWARDLEANIAKADANWPAVLSAPKKN